MVVNGITAWQILLRKAHIRAGQTILVHGANGGVGTTLVQLARHAGVRVIDTASPRHHQALRELDVLPVDYTTPTWPHESVSSPPVASTRRSTTSAATA